MPELESKIMFELTILLMVVPKDSLDLWNNKMYLIELYPIPTSRDLLSIVAKYWKYYRLYILGIRKTRIGFC